MIYLSKRIKHRKHNATFAAIGIALVLIVGCSTAQKAPIDSNESEKPDPSLGAIAVDLVSVLGQLPGYESWAMTAQVSPATSSFGDSLINAMRNAGYGLQRVSADQGINFLEYSKTQTSTDSGDTTEFELAVRDVSVSRNYQWIGARWIPSSAVRITGVKPTPINVYNDLYGKKGTTTKLVTGVQFIDKSGRILSSQASTGRVSGDIDEKFGEQNVLNKSRASVFTRQRSSADEDTRTYRPVSAVTLKFPTKDPSVLGDRNKRAIITLMKQMDATRDQFLIQGCSYGKSLAWDGTEVLSLERQQRVNQELLVAGVKPESIRETGCSEEDRSVNLPRQSVRLTLQRATQPL